MTVNKKIELAMQNPARMDLMDAARLIGIASHRVYTVAYAGGFSSYDKNNPTNGVTLLDVQQVRIALGMPDDEAEDK